jgi:hypothetical protein
MFMKVRIRVLFFLAGFFFLCGLSLFLILYVKGEDLLPHQTVFVPKEKTIEKFTKITGRDFTALFETKEMLSAGITPSMVTIDTLANVMNKTMVLPLFPEEILTFHHVRDNELTPEPNEMEYPLPSSWLEVLDWTGRPGDEVEIWLTPTEKLKQFYAQKAKDNKLPAENPSSVPDTTERPLSKAIFENVRLRYVMDGTNHTVRNAGSLADRSDATGKPMEIKAFLTGPHYAKLKNAVEEGYKLIIAVKE